jgi:predicted house-cleaning noncanonical NTP pyrophosphatase (MazG superfamily)
VVQYDKLVRDRIPEIIREAGKVAITRTVKDPAELKLRLIDKLGEEMQEYRESGSVEEIADILEVLQALVEQVHGLSWEQVREIQGRKWEERGGFRDGIVLERVEG